jgi:hypothetical protein
VPMILVISSRKGCVVTVDDSLGSRLHNSSAG